MRDDPLVCAIGCTAFCLVLALMIGAFGGQTFYPREGSVGMWAAIGLMLRVHVNSRQAAETGQPIFPDEVPAKWFIKGTEENGVPSDDTPGEYLESPPCIIRSDHYRQIHIIPASQNS